MAYTTIKDVLLLRTGTWNASVGGNLPVTAGDLQEMADAAADADLDKPIIKIGHTDGRFPAVDEDGEPAYGQIDNLRLTEDGQGLVGDLVNVPEELAEKMPSAYPHRSVEIRSNVALKTAAGEIAKKFKRVITAVALLGSTPPAVKGLGGIHAALSHGDTLVDEGDAYAVHFKLGAPLTAEQTRQALEQSIGGAGAVVDFTDRLFWYKQAVPSPDGGASTRYFQQTYSETDGQVTLSGEKIEVEPSSSVGFIPKAANSATSPASAPAVGDTPGVPPADPASAQAYAEPPTTERTSEMATLADLFSTLGIEIPEGEDYTAVELPDTAVDALSEAFEAAKKAPGETNGEGAPAGLSEAPTGSVVVSEAQFSELTANNANMKAQLDEMVAERDAERRDQAIETALAEGRLHPSERDAWRTALDNAEESTLSLLSQRAQIVPTSELGHVTAPAATSFSEAQEQALAAYDDEIFGTPRKDA